MDRQEQVQNLAKIARISVSYAEDLYDSFFPKPVVPGFIAEWIEEAKNKQGYNVVGAVNNAPSGNVGNWLILENVDIFTKAWVFGYEVENEPRYTVRLKGLTSKRSYLNYLIDDDRWYLNDEVSSVAARTQHTRGELEKGGFGEVFDNPMFEVTEVTDE